MVVRFDLQIVPLRCGFEKVPLCFFFKFGAYSLEALARDLDKIILRVSPFSACTTVPMLHSSLYGTGLTGRFDR